MIVRPPPQASKPEQTDKAEPAKVEPVAIIIVSYGGRLACGRAFCAKLGAGAATNSSAVNPAMAMVRVCIILSSVGYHPRHTNLTMGQEFGGRAELEEEVAYLRELWRTCDYLPSERFPSTESS